MSRAGIAAFVSTHGVSRHHREIRQLRKAIDERVHQAVAQVIDIYVLTDIRQGQYSERSDPGSLRTQEENRRS